MVKCIVDVQCCILQMSTICLESVYFVFRWTTDISAYDLNFPCFFYLVLILFFSFPISILHQTEIHQSDFAFIFIFSFCEFHGLPRTTQTCKSQGSDSGREDAQNWPIIIIRFYWRYTLILGICAKTSMPVQLKWNKTAMERGNR